MCISGVNRPFRFGSMLLVVTAFLFIGIIVSDFNAWVMVLGFPFWAACVFSYYSRDVVDYYEVEDRCLEAETSLLRNYDHQAKMLWQLSDVKSEKKQLSIMNDELLIANRNLSEQNDKFHNQIKLYKDRIGVHMSANDMLERRVKELMAWFEASCLNHNSCDEDDEHNKNCLNHGPACGTGRVKDCAESTEKKYDVSDFIDANDLRRGCNAG